MTIFNEFDVFYFYYSISTRNCGNFEPPWRKTKGRQKLKSQPHRNPILQPTNRQVFRTFFYQFHFISCYSLFTLFFDQFTVSLIDLWICRLIRGFIDLRLSIESVSTASLSIDSRFYFPVNSCRSNRHPSFNSIDRFTFLFYDLLMSIESPPVLCSTIARIAVDQLRFFNQCTRAYSLWWAGYRN